MRVSVRAAWKLKNYTLGIKDSTARLDLISALLRTIPTNDQKTCPCPSKLGVFVSSNDVRHKFMMTQCDLLYWRSRCSYDTGDLDGALVDSRAAVALKYSLCKQVETSDISQELMVMARKKAASPRPHFSDSEIRSWNKELHIKEYSAEN